MPLKLIRRKGRPHWYASGSIGGVRYVESTGTAKKPLAEAWLRNREREIERGVYLGEAAAATFAAAVLVYLEKGGERRFLKPLLDRFGPMLLSALTPAIVSAAAADLYGHAKPATVRRQFYVPLNAVMKQASEAKLCHPISFDAPKVKREPVAYADDKWLAAFMGEAHFRIAVTVLFLTLTGARVSEACRLAPSDLDLDRGEAVLRKTKSGKPRRVALAPVLVDGLRRAIVECAKEIDGGARVFGYADRFGVNQAIRRTCARAGIPYLSSHKVGRHAAAARLLAQGASLQAVRDAFGWASLSVVSDNYGHLEQQAIDAAVRGAASTVPALPTRKDGKG